MHVHACTCTCTCTCTGGGACMCPAPSRPVTACAAARLEVLAPPLRLVFRRYVRPHPLQAMDVDGPPSRGHRQQELAGPDPLPAGRQHGPVVVVLVELAYEDKVDFVLAERRPICPIMVGHRWPRWTRHDNGPATRQGQTLPTAGHCWGRLGHDVATVIKVCFVMKKPCPCVA